MASASDHHQSVSRLSTARRTHRLPPPFPLDTKEETPAKAKVSPFKSQPKTPPSFSDDEGLEFYPFVETPLQFDFGRGYGGHLFYEAQKQIMYETGNNGRPPQLGGGVTEEMKHSKEEIYEFSPEEEMIASFFTEGLF